MAQRSTAGGSKPPGQRRKRRIPIEHYDRVSLMLISMVPYSEIEKQMSLSWGKSRSYVRDIIKEVHTDWAEGALLVQDTRRHQIRQGFEALYMRCMNSQPPQLRTAARILAELGRLDGCYLPDQVEVSHQGTVGVGISLGSLGLKNPQEVTDRIAYLQHLIDTRGAGALQAGQAAAVAQAHLSGTPIDNHTNGEPEPAEFIDIPWEKKGGA